MSFKNAFKFYAHLAIFIIGYAFTGLFTTGPITADTVTIIGSIWAAMIVIMGKDTGK